MSLDNDLFWCAVRECSPPETLVSRLYGPRASVRVASREDSLDAPEARGYFQKGPWTFFVAPSEIFDPAKHFPHHDVFYLRHVASSSWASLEHSINGVHDWTIYGADDDEYVRVEGAPPPKAMRFVAATKDVSHVAVKVGKALLGFRHDQKPPPAGLHVIEMARVRKLVVDGVTSDDPSLEDVHAALRAGLPVTLVVGEGVGVKSMLATFDGGKPRVAMHARFKMLANRRGAGSGSIDHEDVRALFETFYPAAGHPFAYEWSIVAEPTRMDPRIEPAQR